VFLTVQARVGPGGGTAKSPERDGTAQCTSSPSSSVNAEDGRHYEGRGASRCEIISGRDGRCLRKTAGGDRGRQVTAED